MPNKLIRQTLDNGFRIIASPMENTRAVAINLTLACGSRHEGDSEGGMTHFGEHLVFKGTPNYDWKALAKAINLLGGNVNACTSTDWVRVYATVMDEDLEEALGLLSEMFLHSTFPEKEVDRERGVILEEIAMYEDIPDDLCYENFTQSLLLPHPAGRPVLGPAGGVSVYTADGLRDFWHSRMMPERMVLSVAGAFKKEELLSISNRLFGSLEKRETYLNSDNGTKLQHNIVRIDRDLEQINFCFGTSGPSKGDDQRYAWALYDTILGGGMGSRLFDEVREQRGLAYSIGSSLNPLDGLGFLSISGSTRAEFAAEAINVSYDVLNIMAKEGPDAEELSTAKRQLERMIVLAQESVAGHSGLIGEREMYNLEHISTEEVIRRLYAVTLDDIQEVAESVISFGQPAACFVGPLEKAKGLDKVFASS